MTDEMERDEVVAAALRELPVPEHRPGFWESLEASLRTGDAPAPAPATGPATGELPAVTSLADRPAGKRHVSLLFGAAAAAVLLVAVGLVLVGGDGGGSGEGTETAQESEVTTGEVTTEAEDQDAPTTTAAAPPAAVAAAAPEAVVTDWLDALGEGEIAAAAALTGPRSAAYIQSLDPAATVEGYLSESQEGYGAWSGAEDREVTVTDIGPMDFDGGTLQVVVVSGTYPGEGGADGPRVDVFPVVDDGEGFKVEHLAFSPDRDNDPVFTVPDESETGLATVDPEAEINVFVPAEGTVWFSVDGAPAEADTTSIVAEEPFALHDPPGDLTAGPHELVVVAVGDDGTISHYGGTFEVEP